MDTFENNTLFPQQDEPPVEPESHMPADADSAETDSAPVDSAPVTSQEEPAVYHGMGTGRKESPYANSPYVAREPAQPSRQGTSEKKSKPAKKAKTNGFMKKAVAVLLAIAIAAASASITAALINSRWDERMWQTEKQFQNQIQDLQDQIDALSRANGNSLSGSPVTSVSGLTPAQVYAQNVDSVVAISTVVKQTSYFGQTSEGTSAGSGFILSKDGYVITNYHVVEGASAIQVILHNSTEYPAKLVGHDSTNDVAVLKVEAQDLPAVTLGSSSDLIIGDMVVAIGNPLGELASTQTVGYVSGIGREVSTDGLTSISMIQTDAAINPGNSGGPLFNMKGEVIGITTAKYSGTTTSGASIEGIGFAIPINDVVAMIDDLIDYGYVTGAYLGVSVQNVDAASAAMYNLPSGAYVAEVVEGVSAHRAGVQPKDIIVDLGGYEVTSVTTLTRALRNFRAGDVTTITVVRAGARITLDIELDEKPGDLGIVSTEEEPTMPSEGNYEDWYEYFRKHFGE